MPGSCRFCIATTSESRRAEQGASVVEAAVGEDSGSVSVRFQESDYQTSYTATGVDKPRVPNWGLSQEEFFNERDVASSSPVVVLGQMRGEFETAPMLTL